MNSVLFPPRWQRGFWCLMATQAQNAFSDNALKNLVILLVLSQPLSDAERQTTVALAGALFATPFILFSMLGGWLADRFSKQRVMAWVKLAEIGIMLLAAVGLGVGSLAAQLLAIFLMGCHSALFGPAKYGILPEILPLSKLCWGNGLLELLTFMGIILGTAAGGLLAAAFRGHPSFPGLILAGLAAAGWFCSKGIPHTTAANPGCSLRINPVTDLWRQLLAMRKDRDLWRANLGNTAFFFVAALVQMNLVIHARSVLALDEMQNGLLNAVLALGIGLGSVVAGYASRGKIEYRLVPLGALIMALATLPMGWSGISTTGFCAALVALGLGGGLFIVPVAAVLQHRPAQEEKGAVQGAASVLSFVGILGASGAQVVLGEYAHFETGAVFWACGVAAGMAGGYIAATRRGV